MANNKDPEIKGTIGMEYDSSGADEAKEDIKETAKATEEAAEKSAAAETQSRAAAGKSTEAEKALAETMRLVAMGKRALVEEIKRLSAARKAAAASGDQKQYEKLTQSLNAAKQALEGVNTAAAMAQISTMQQAQAGMQMAQGFSSLADMAQHAGSNIAGMANQVISLGMAMKAGLGPIGWVMAALQGLQMAISSYVKHQREASQAIKDFAKDVEESCARMEESARKVAEMRLKDNERIQSQEEKDAKVRLETKLRTLDAEAKANQDHRDSELEKKRAALDAEIALEQEKAERPGGDKAAFEKWRQEKEAQFRAEEKMAREAAQAEAKARADEELKGAQEIAAIRRKAYDDLTDKYVNIAGMGDEERLKLEQAVSDIDKLREQKQAATRRVEDLNKQMEDLKKAGGREDEVDELRRLRTEAANDALEVEKKIADRIYLLERDTAWMGDLLKKDPENLNLSGEALARRGLALAQEGNARREAAEAAEREVEQMQQQEKELARQTSTTQKTTEAQEQLQKTQDEIALRKAQEARREEQRQKQEEERAQVWSKLQQQNLAAQQTWLQQTLAALPIASKERQQYTAALQSVNQAMLAEQWATVQQERCLQEQAAWLQTQLGQIQQGSKLWEEYNRNLQGVQTRQIQEALGNLEKEFKVTGNYVAEDKRTQRQILLDDKAALEGRAQRLRGLIAETKDHALRLQLQEKLDETVKQQKALEAATAANAKACRAMLKAYKAPEFHDKNKMVENNLKRLGHAYERNIKLAEKAAEKGNTNAQERYTRLATGFAERIARKRKDFTKEHEKNLDALKAAQKKQKDEEEESAKDAKKNRARKNREDTKKKPEPKKDTPKPKDPQPQQQRKEQELADTKATLKTTQEALSDMSTKIADLAATSSAIASAAAQIAKSAGTSLKNLKKQLKTMQTDIANLWKEVDA